MVLAPRKKENRYNTCGYVPWRFSCMYIPVSLRVTLLLQQIIQGAWMWCLRPVMKREIVSFPAGQLLWLLSCTLPYFFFFFSFIYPTIYMFTNLAVYSSLCFLSPCILLTYLTVFMFIHLRVYLCIFFLYFIYPLFYLCMHLFIGLFLYFFILQCLIHLVN